METCGDEWTFTPLPLNPQGKSLQYPSDRRPDGPQSRSGLCGEEKNLALRGLKTERKNIWNVGSTAYLYSVVTQKCNPHA
jgi:hypothetical protein